LTRRDVVLKHVAENFFGLPLGEEIIGPDFANVDNKTGDSTVSETIKFLLRTREAVDTLEPIVFRQLIEPDSHWDEPNRWSV
jgi:hypothetical protein